MTNTLTFSVPGMTCGHCESAIKTEVGAVDGVASVEVDLTTKIVTVNGDDLDPTTLKEAIDEAGFDVAE